MRVPVKDCKCLIIEDMPVRHQTQNHSQSPNSNKRESLDVDSKEWLFPPDPHKMKEKGLEDQKSLWTSKGKDKTAQSTGTKFSQQLRLQANKINGKRTSIHCGKYSTPSYEEKTSIFARARPPSERWGHCGRG